MKKHLANLALTATLTLAITLTISCGNHTFEELLGLESSSSQQEDYSSSSSLAKLSSSSSGQQSSDSQQQGGGVPVVGPLIKTQWNQQDPYNMLLPICDRIYETCSKVGERENTGCAATATAQIMKYHNYPSQYDYDNMLNIYKNVNATEQQRNSVATLMRDLNIKIYNGGRTTLNWRKLALEYGYDKSLQSLNTKYYKDAAQLGAIIKEQLDSGLPILCEGTLPDGSIYGHAYIIDGYDNTGKFHVNWGWGGSKDGYYSIDSKGSYYSLYNNQEEYGNIEVITINIKPDKGGVEGYVLGLDVFSTKRTSVLQNETFTVRVDFNLQGSYPRPTAQLGVALVDNNRNIVTILGTHELLGAYSHINCVVPDSVKPGKYNLMVAVKNEGGEWKLVELYNRNSIQNDISNTIEFHVIPSSEAIAVDMKLLEFESDKDYVQHNEPFVVSVEMENRSLFPGGQIGAVLVDNNGKMLSVVCSKNLAELKLDAKFKTELNCTIPENIESGQYGLSIAIKPTGGEWRTVFTRHTYSSRVVPNVINFTVKPGSGTDGRSETMFEVFPAVSMEFSSEKTIFIQNEPFTVLMRVKSLEEDSELQVSEVLVDDKGKIVATLNINKPIDYLKLKNSYLYGSYILIDCKIPETVPRGQYSLRIAIKTKDSNEWTLSTRTPTDIPNSISIKVL
jgi:hypothetical protein